MYIDKESLKRFAYAISIPLSVSDTVKWPIRAGRAIKPVKKEFALEYAEQLKYGKWHFKIPRKSGVFRII